MATERFTQRPPRYTEASLVRRLEELGIGRPSTYAPTIQTIQNREYVVKGDKEGVERAYTVVSLSKGKIEEAEKTETVGADRNKLMPTDNRYGSKRLFRWSISRMCWITTLRPV